MEKTDLIAMGGALKALPGGRVGGYLIMFGGQDLTGEHFTSETDLKWSGGDTRPALYHHGQDETLNGQELGDGWKRIKTDDIGLWVETQLNLRDEYEQAIYDLTKAGKLGLSSGSAAHMILKEDNGKITRWPIVEGSFTPTPAEPRTTVLPLKAAPFTPLKTLAQPPAAETAEPPKEDATKGDPDGDSAGDAALVPASGKNIKAVKTSGGFKTMNLIEAIKKLVPGLADEQYAAIEAVLGLAGITGSQSEQEADAIMAAMPGEDQPIRSADIAAAVAEAVKQLGIQPDSPNGKAGRPPYQFKPEPEPQQPDAGDAVKSVALMRFGETPEAIKAVANDLYGSDYEVQRLKQHRAFGKYARYGKEAIDATERKALKTVILTPTQLKAAVVNGVAVAALKAEMSEVVDSLGGYLVPEDMRLDMIERLPGRTTVRSRADVSSTSSDVMTRVKVTGGDNRYTSAMRVTWVGDSPAANAADSAPTFGVEKTPIHIAKITVPVPMALLEDSAYPLSNKLGEWASQSYGLDEDAQFLTGNGIAKPEGVLPGSTNLNTRLSEVINGSTSAVDADKVIDVQYSLAQQYWQDAVWVMNRSTAGAVRQLKAGDGHYLWRDGLEAGQPPTLLGFPVELNEAMPSIASNAYPILFGNFYEGYQIADRIGMSLLRDEVTEAEQDIVKFLFRRRLGGQVKGEWAFATLKMST
jgi:HK97 family phage major capsid protein